MVKRINILLTAVMLVMILPAAYSLNYRPSQRYEMSGDLGIYFTNVDAVVEKVRQGLHDHSEKITVTYNSHYDNMEKIPEIVRLLVDHALEETDDPTEGDYIYHQYGGYEYSYKYSQSDGIYRYTIEIVPEYYTYLNQEEEVDDRINKLIDSFDFGILTSDYEKVRTIYSYVYDNVSYDDVHKNNSGHRLKNTAYGALFYGRAVCQGYAVLMYRLLRECGINSRIITGTAVYEDKEEFHAWNIAEIDGKYYNIDITWDDQSGTEDYFLKCDENFSSHIRDEKYATEDFYNEYPMADRDYERKN